MTPDTGQSLANALEAAEAASPVDAVDAVTSELARSLGTGRIALLIADLAGRKMVRLGQGDLGPHTRHQRDESAITIPLSDAAIQRVLVEQRPVTVPTAEGWRVLAPVSQRGEVIGQLEVILDLEPTDDAVQLVQRAAHVLAFVIIANRRHTDLYEWGQRTTRFELSAEIQRRLLPDAFTCEAGELTLSAWLEPAATIGGDTFDYSLERDHFHFSVTDAMGHGVASALTATLGVGSLRNSRRAGASLSQQAEAANAAMHLHAKDSFITGVLGRIELRTGVLGLVNVGHVLPLLMRGDVITSVELPIDRPFGLNEDRPYRQTDVELEPGDRLVVVTDGMLERRAADLRLTELLAQTRSMHAREATRHLADRVLDVAGPELADDATILMLDWHGADKRRRDSGAGADNHTP